MAETEEIITDFKPIESGVITDFRPVKGSQGEPSVEGEYPETYLTKAEPFSVVDKIMDYLNITPIKGVRKTTPLELETVGTKKTPFDIKEEVFGTGRVVEFQRVLERGLSAVSFGATDLISKMVKGEVELPETVPGVIGGAGAELFGFLAGPYQAAKFVTGTRLAPTADGLKRVGQAMVEGTANLGIASVLSNTLPSLLKSETLTDSTMAVGESGVMGGLVGALFPTFALVPSKPLRLAVGLAVMDKVRAGFGEWFTVDDVVTGIASGQIDKKELAERAFGYLMDFYFISHVPSMKKQVSAQDQNKVVREISKLNADELLDTIVTLEKQGFIPGSPKREETNIDYKEIDFLELLTEKKKPGVGGEEKVEGKTEPKVEVEKPPTVTPPEPEKVAPATPGEGGKRIEESAGGPLWLQSPTYEAFLKEAKTAGFSKEDTGIITEKAFLEERQKAIEKYVEEPVRFLMKEVYKEGGSPYSSNAYGPGPKGVFYTDKEGKKSFKPLAPPKPPIAEPGKVGGEPLKLAEEKKATPAKIPKKKKPPKEETNTLVSWVRISEGGIWDKQLTGETRQFQGRESGIIGLVSKKGKDFDKLTQRAMEEDWLPKGSTERDFINLLEQDAMAAKEGGPRVQKMGGEYKEKQHPEFTLTPEEKTAEDKGFDLTGGSVRVGDLKEGDKIMIKGEEFEHKGFDSEGNAIIKDGKTITEDPFGEIAAEGIKIAPVDRQAEILKQIETEDPEAYAKILKGNTEEMVKDWEMKRAGKSKAMTQEGMFEEKKPQGALFGAERKLAGEVSKAQERVFQSSGEVVISQGGKAEKFTFEDPEQEARFEGAKGVPEESFWEKVKNTLEGIKFKATREFEHLPKNKEFAQLRFDLLLLAKERGIASDKTLRAIQGILSEIKDGNVGDLFRRKVILDDLWATAEKGKDIPFGFTPKSLKSELARIEVEIAKHPEIGRALDKRSEFWDSLKADYVYSLKDIGFDVSDRLTNANYFRHQILDYAKVKSVLGSKQKLQTPSGRGFLKKREGSELDINTDYLQAETEVMAQMIHDIKVAQVIKAIDQNYNISGSLRNRAREMNFEKLVGGPENVRRIRELEGHLRELRDSEGPMDSETKMMAKAIAEELRELDPTRPFQQKIAIGFSKLEKMDIIVENISEVAELAKGEGDASGIAKYILKAITDKENFISESLKNDYLQWKHFLDDRMLPEGYSKWQPREGNVFYMADTIPSSLAEQLKSGALEEVGVTADLLKQVMAVGGKRKEFVVKDEVSLTLDNLSPSKGENIVSEVSKDLLKAWKVWTLISPRRLLKYNIRNMTGDADAAFIGNPEGFRWTPQATKELYDVFAGDRPMTPDMKDWFERGGMQSTLQYQEMGDINQLRIFKDFLDKHISLKDIPKELWNKYWTAARLSTDFREAILRYANYLSFKDQMTNNKGGKPDSFGASIPEEIMGLKDIKDRAFWLQNDLMGAYDRVSIVGKHLREHIYPFWSWKELNFKRYINFAKNAADNGELTMAIGKKAVNVAASPYTYMRIGSFLLKATAFWGALQAWNTLMFPELEKDLPESEKSRPHIIFGKTKEGKIINFTRIGALGDFLQWFGLDAGPKHVESWMSGKMTLREIAIEMAKSPLNVIVQGLTPIAKVPAEILTRRSLFPDVTKPGTIRDRWGYVARNLGLEDEYNAITGKPSEGYVKSLSKFVVYETDPLQVAYHEINDAKQRFLKKIGKESEGFWLTPRGNALYNMKLARRYNDKRAYSEAMLEYAMLGGTKEGMMQSLKNMSPLAGLNKMDLGRFIQSMNAEDRERLPKAMKYYSTVLLGMKGENQ